MSYCGTCSQPISDLKVDVKYPNIVYLNSQGEIEVTVRNVGPLPTSEVNVRFDTPGDGLFILLREKNVPEVLKPGDSAKFIFDMTGKSIGEYKPKITWEWRESEHVTRANEDTLPTPISVQEPPFTFNLGWILIIGSAGGGVAYVVYHVRRKMRQMEQEPNKQSPDSDKESTD